MDAQTINQNFDLFSLAEHDTALKATGAYQIGPCPFCGGRDRFTLKKTPDGWRWHCRQCGDGKYHTPIDYVMQRDNLDFKAALSWMGGKIHHNPPKPRAEPTAAAVSLPPLDWRTKEVESARDALETPAGSIGREYLQRRGIDKGAWLTWRVGFDHVFDPQVKRRRPALSLPWWEYPHDGADPRVTAIKYRFVDDDPAGLRYIAQAGSAFVLYGLWDVLPTHHTLLLVEGEINSLSIWQMHPAGVTALSFGSEGGARPDVLRAVAAHYRRVFIWADDPKLGADLRAILPGSVAMHSPERDGVKFDANRMLQERVLGNVLTQALGVACYGKYV